MIENPLAAVNGFVRNKTIFQGSGNQAVVDLTRSISEIQKISDLIFDFIVI